MAWLAFPAWLVAADALAKGTWQRLEMEDCAILSDCAPKEIERFAVGYAAYRDVMRKLLLGPTVKLPRSEVVLFRKGDAFRAYVPPGKGENFIIKAYSIEVDGTAVTAICADSDRQEAMTSLIEFETIWMLRRVRIWVPLWMSQGAGQVLSTLYLDRNGLCVVGAEASRFTVPLAHNEYFDWDRFVSIYLDSPEYRGDKDPGVYHAQAWATMHWVLLAGGEGGQARFRDLASQVRSRKALPALTAVMGVDEGALTTTIKKHLRTAKELKWPFDEKTLRAAWTLRPVPEHEIRARLVDVLAAAGKQVEARAELAKAGQLAPKTATVLEARARQALRDNEPEAAAALYREAMELGSVNPQAYLLSARVRLDASSVGRADYAGSGGHNVPLALADIRQALGLAPDSADAYELMGRAFYLSSQLNEENIAELSQGIGPGRSRVRYYRALLYERLAQYDACLDDLRAVVADLECPLAERRNYARRIPQVYFSKHRAMTDELIKAKEYTAATTLLTQARSQNPEESAQYDKLLRWVLDQERVVVFRSLREQVQSLVNSRQYSEALELIQKQIASTPNEALQKLCVDIQTWVEENQAVHRLNTLYRSRDWEAFREQLRLFEEKYPQSDALPNFRTMDSRAAKRQKSSGDPSKAD